MNIKMRKKKIRSNLVTPAVFFLLFFIVNLPILAHSSNINKSLHEKPVLHEILTLHGVIKNGDTVSSLLDPYLPLKTIYEISKKKTDGFSLARIKKGHPYKLIVKGKDLIRFEYEIDDQDRLIVQKKEKGFLVKKDPIEYDLQVETVSAVITTSLFNAIKKIGEKTELAIRLADIFAWDVDFIRDIRPGDHFKVLVQKRYRDGKFCGYGQIQAAFFTNREMLFKAFLF
ncbi:MAG: hypothetical protein GY760_02325, partial [Deltaproteobacteria bacterium]|nr:hypothetical protein [Deltaproteobacteria bacterium]